MDKPFAFGSGRRLPKLKHIVEDRIYNRSTQRSEVFAYCGVSEEASGSGRHSLEDEGAPACEDCKRLENARFDRYRAERDAELDLISEDKPVR